MLHDWRSSREVKIETNGRKDRKRYKYSSLVRVKGSCRDKWRKFDDGWVSVGNKSYYLNEYGLIHRGVRVANFARGCSSDYLCIASAHIYEHVPRLPPSSIPN